MQLCPYTECGIDINRFQKTKEEKKEGAFSTFYIVEDKESGTKYGAKVLRGKISEQNINRELGILMLANHPTIVKFYGFSLRDLNNEDNVTLILELASKGSLLDVLIQNRNGEIAPGYDNTIRQMILVGICRGMKYLHDRNIVHRDLKPGNVLLNEYYEPLITDFGMSKFFEVDHSNSGSQFGGTPYYMAPEVIMRSSFGRKADVYAF